MKSSQILIGLLLFIIIFLSLVISLKPVENMDTMLTYVLGSSNPWVSPQFKVNNSVQNNPISSSVMDVAPLPSPTTTTPSPTTTTPSLTTTTPSLTTTTPSFITTTPSPTTTTPSPTTTTPSPTTTTPSPTTTTPSPTTTTPSPTTTTPPVPPSSAIISQINNLVISIQNTLNSATTNINEVISFLNNYIPTDLNPNDPINNPKGVELTAEQVKILNEQSQQMISQITETTNKLKSVVPSSSIQTNDQAIQILNTLNSISTDANNEQLIAVQISTTKKYFPIPNKNFPYNDIIYFKTPFTPNSSDPYYNCSYQCDKTPGCIGYVPDTPTGANCWLKSKFTGEYTSNLTTYYSSGNDPSTTPSPTTKKYFSIPNKNFPYNDISYFKTSFTPNSTDPYYNCSYQCDNTAGCIGYVPDTPTGANCWLKSKFTGGYTSNLTTFYSSGNAPL